MNNASAKEEAQCKRREMGCAVVHLSPCKGSEPQSLHVSCPQTMALQMNAIFVPWRFNPCSMMSLSDGSGLDFFIIMSRMVKTVIAHV